MPRLRSCVSAPCRKEPAAGKEAGSLKYYMVQQFVGPLRKVRAKPPKERTRDAALRALQGSIPAALAVHLRRTELPLRPTPRRAKCVKASEAAAVSSVGSPLSRAQWIAAQKKAGGKGAPSSAPLEALMSLAHGGTVTKCIDIAGRCSVL